LRSSRRPARNVVVLADEASRLSPRTVNRMLTGGVGFYELQPRHGNQLAEQMVVGTRSGRGGYDPFLHGVARGRPRGRVVRLAEQKLLPRTLTLEQVAAVIDAQERLRDRFLFALLASTGMRIGQALGLRHEMSSRGSVGSRSAPAATLTVERGARAACRSRPS
jgi:integrase/recombinase XerD